MPAGDLMMPTPEFAFFVLGFPIAGVVFVAIMYWRARAVRAS